MSVLPSCRRACVCAFVASLGCASSRPVAQPVSTGEPSPASTESTLSGALSRAERAPALEREAFVRAVLERNPSLAAARHGIRAALARGRQAGAFEDPMLDLGVAPLSIASDAPLGFEVGISQKLPWFGKRALESEASRAEAAAAQSDYESVKRELALTAVLLYDDYFVVMRSLEINEHHVALMRAMRESAVVQLSSGRGSAGDALMAESELTLMERDAVLLGTQRDVTVAQMNELLHRAPELSLPPPPKELSLPGEPGTDSTATRRPDIAAAEQRARAEQARAERAEKDAYPDLTLSTSYNSMWEMPEHRWMVGATLNLPLQSGPRSGAADEARAMRAELLSDVARMTAAARTEAFIARKQLEESRRLLELYEKRLLPVARDAIDAARADFVTSRAPFNAVIGAERNLRAVELDYQTKRAEYVRRRAELDRAVGRIPGLEWREERR